MAADQPHHDSHLAESSVEESAGLDIGDEILIEAGDDSDEFRIDIATFDDTDGVADGGDQHAGAWLLWDSRPLSRASEPADISALWAGQVAIEPVDDFADRALLGDREPARDDDTHW